jgi:hypothetical protein
MTDFQRPHRLLAHPSLDSWALSVATALLALVFLGILPHIH